MDALEPRVAIGKVELLDVEVKLVGSAIGISPDCHLRIGQLESFQREKESIVSLGCIHHLFDVDRKFTTVGLD